MKATVTAASKKSAAKKPAVTPKAKTVVKTAGLGKKITSALKSTAETRKASSKTATKPLAKSAAKAVAKTTMPKKPAKASGTSKIAAPQKTATVAKTAPEKTPLPRAKAPQHPEKVNPGYAQSGKLMSGNKDSAKSADKIEKPVVSKVSEVATKTSKSIPETVTDGSLLTEEQILKMSDKDYMNEVQLAFFRARLQQLEKELLKNAGETTEHLRETVLVPDPADRATIEEEHALELRTRDRERKLLKKVQQSIAAIDSGDYGWCEETGEPIGIPRLLARPTATLSLEAQQRRELKQKLYGD